MQRAILVVDDHESLRRSLREWLQKEYADCEILDAASGEEAITVAEDRPLSLVVMDIGLPGISGIEATRQLKLLAPKLPVVILSVYGGDSYRADAQEAGAVAYVQKRELQKELLPALSKLISSVEDRPNGPLQQSAEEG